MFRPGLLKARLFFSGVSKKQNLLVSEPSKSLSIRANPLKSGGAKLRVYDWDFPQPDSRATEISRVMA
jgi:hypothetical protein